MLTARGYERHVGRGLPEDSLAKRDVTSPGDWYQPIVAIKWEKGFNLIAFMSKEWSR